MMQADAVTSGTVLTRARKNGSLDSSPPRTNAVPGFSELRAAAWRHLGQRRCSLVAAALRAVARATPRYATRTRDAAGSWHIFAWDDDDHLVRVAAVRNHRVARFGDHRTSPEVVIIEDEFVDVDALVPRLRRLNLPLTREHGSSP